MQKGRMPNDSFVIPPSSFFGNSYFGIRLSSAFFVRYGKHHSPHAALGAGGHDRLETVTDRQRHLAEIRAQNEGIGYEDSMVKGAAGTAMKRFAAPREIGDAIAFLCSQQASYVSGVSLLVDGATTCAYG